jgi:hypothetical protein
MAYDTSILDEGPLSTDFCCSTAAFLYAGFWPWTGDKTLIKENKASREFHLFLI